MKTKETKCHNCKFFTYVSDDPYPHYSLYCTKQHFHGGDPAEYDEDEDIEKDFWGDCEDYIKGENEFNKPTVVRKNTILEDLPDDYDFFEELNN